MYTLLIFSCLVVVLNSSSLDQFSYSNPSSHSNAIYNSRENPTVAEIESYKATLFKTGTTIVAICCKDGVVMGADTRATGGSLVMDKGKLKIHNISPRIYCLAAGTSADCDQLVRKAGFLLANYRMERNLAGADLMDSVFYACKCIVEAILHSDKHRTIQSVLLIGGIDDNGPSLYEIDMDGSYHRVSCSALGSGSLHATSILESSRRLRWGPTIITSSADGVPGVIQAMEDTTVQDAIDVVRKAIQAGIKNDLGSGSHVDICVIKHGGVDGWREYVVDRSKQKPGISNSDHIESSSHDSNTPGTISSIGSKIISAKLMEVKNINLLNDSELIPQDRTIFTPNIPVIEKIQ